MVSCASEKKSEILDILNNKSTEQLNKTKETKDSFHDLYGTQGHAKSRFADDKSRTLSKKQLLLNKIQMIGKKDNKTKDSQIVIVN